MSASFCWHCGKPLVEIDGNRVWAEYKDPVGNVHKLHKLCAQSGEYGKPITASFQPDDIYGKEQP